jgi:hypothetical protein
MFFAMFRRPKDPARHMAAGPKAKIRLGLEILEDRTLLSTVTWINASSGDWDTAANWRDDMGNNRLPGAADDVVIPSGSYTITHGSAVTDAVASITNQAVIVFSDGTLNVSGNVAGSGVFTLSGGTLGNATVTAGTTVTGTTSGGTLSRVTIDGVLDMTGGNTYGITVNAIDGLTLNGLVKVGNSQGTSSGDLYFADSEMVGGGGDIVLGGSLSNRVEPTVSGSTVIVGPGLKIHGAGGAVGGFINQGTIADDVPDGTIFASFLINDNGTLNATSAPGARLIIVGTLSNTNSALTVSGPGQVTLSGTIDGGTVTCVNGGQLLGTWTGTSGGVLSGVILRDATLTTDSTHAVAVANGLTLIGDVNLDGSLLCMTTETIGGTGRLVFSSNLHNQLISSPDSITVTLGPEASIHGLFVTFYPTNASFINEGTIGPDAGGLFYIKKNIINQNGTLSAASGAHLDVVNNSVIDNTNSTLTLSGAGAIFLGGSLSLGTGTIRGGSLASANGGKLAGSESTGYYDRGYLDGVTLDADLDLTGVLLGINDPSIFIENGLTVNRTVFIGKSDGTSWGDLTGFFSDEPIHGTGDILFGGDGRNAIGGYGGPILDATMTVHGKSGTINPGVVNYGTIAADVAGGTIVLGALTNYGTVEALNGGILSCNTNPGNFTGGTLTGGVWKAFDNSSLAMSFNATFTTDAATIVLDGPNSHFAYLDWYDLGNLFTVASAGRLTIENARNWRPGHDIANQGTLTIGLGSTITVPGYDADTGTLQILPNATLDLSGGGTINGSAQLDGTLNVAVGATLEMASSAGGTGNLNVAGSLVVDSGATLTLGGTYSQSGNLTVQDGGLLDLPGTFTNFANNTLTASSYDILGTFQFTGANIVTNAAQITVDGPDAQTVDENGNDALASLAMNQDGASFTLQNGSAEFPAGDVANAGTLVVGPGSTFVPAGIYLQTAGITILNGGTLGAGVLVDLEGGILSGSGIIEASVQNASEIDIGTIDAAGSLTITGDYTQTSTGVLTLKIGGYNPGTDFDQLNVSGTATLDGTVNITLLNGFTPTPGDGFQVLTFGAVIGNFATYNGLDLGGGLSLAPVYDINSLTLVTMSGPGPSSQSHGLCELAILDGAFAEVLGHRVGFQSVRPVETD